MVYLKVQPAGSRKSPSFAGACLATTIVRKLTDDCGSRMAFAEAVAQIGPTCRGRVRLITSGTKARLITLRRYRQRGTRMVPPFSRRSKPTRIQVDYTNTRKDGGRGCFRKRSNISRLTKASHWLKPLNVFFREICLKSGALQEYLLASMRLRLSVYPQPVRRPSPSPSVSRITGGDRPTP